MKYYMNQNEYTDFLVRFFELLYPPKYTLKRQFEMNKLTIRAICLQTDGPTIIS